MQQNGRKRRGSVFPGHPVFRRPFLNKLLIFRIGRALGGGTLAKERSSAGPSPVTRLATLPAGSLPDGAGEETALPEPGALEEVPAFRLMPQAAIPAVSSPGRSSTPLCHTFWHFHLARDIPMQRAPIQGAAGSRPAHLETGQRTGPGLCTALHRPASRRGAKQNGRPRKA